MARFLERFFSDLPTVLNRTVLHRAFTAMPTHTVSWWLSNVDLMTDDEGSLVALLALRSNANQWATQVRLGSVAWIEHVSLESFGNSTALAWLGATPEKLFSVADTRRLPKRDWSSSFAEPLPPAWISPPRTPASHHAPCIRITRTGETLQSQDALTVYVFGLKMLLGFALPSSSSTAQTAMSLDSDHRLCLSVWFEASGSNPVKFRRHLLVGGTVHASSGAKFKLEPPVACNGTVFKALLPNAFLASLPEGQAVIISLQEITIS